MTTYDQLLRALYMLGSEAWINQYFDLGKRLITDLDLSSEDPRLLLSTPKDGRLPFSLGQRYVLLSRNEELIHCIVPSDFSMAGIEGYDPGYVFSPNTTRDARWVTVRYPLGGSFPERLYKAMLSSCQTILQRTKKTSFRRHHNDLVYHFAMNPEMRGTMLQDLSASLKGESSAVKRSNDSVQRGIKRILLTWNPKRWEWDEIDEDIEDVRQFGAINMRWSCGVSKDIQPGDRAFLIRLGKDNPGIVGSGTVRSSPFVDQHFSDEDREANYIDVDFDTLLHPEEDPLLPMEVLKLELPEQLWTPQGSGISIREEVAPRLEALWFDHLRKGDFIYDPWEEPESPEPVALHEGGSYQITQTRYERNPEARRQCLQNHGYGCKVCCFDFEQTYGIHGKDFIHVHHVKPISEIGAVYQVNPVDDLVPVCPNCHAMLHRGSQPPSLEDLRAMIQKNMKPLGS